MPKLASYALDDRDRQILSELSADAWLTYSEVSERIHMSASAVQRRVERMIEAGVILGAKAVISPQALDRPLRLYALVELRDESRERLAGFARRIAAAAIVTESFYVAGDVDVVITFQVRDMEEYSAFTERHFSSDPNVRRFRTLTSLKPLKS